MKPFNDNFYQNNFNINSPDNNLHYFSSMKGKLYIFKKNNIGNIGLISSERKTINEKNFNSIIHGKKIDFNEDEFSENEKNYNNGNNVIINNINNQNINLKQNISINKINNITNNTSNRTNNEMTNRAYVSVKHINNNIMNNVNLSKIKCTCSKTGCLKKYCACFANGISCDGCDCKNCENISIKNNIENENISNNKEEKLNNYSSIRIQSPKNQRIICNCTKSYCMKKYCECFKQGYNCNSLCRCVECKNKTNINNNTTIPYKEIHDFSASYLPENVNDKDDIKQIDYRLCCNYKSEAFGICVRKEKLKIEERDINLNNLNNNYLIINNNEINATPKFSKKKRIRSKNIESANLKTCPTTNSANKKGRGLSSSVNKNIQKKKLQLN